ncbi:gamma-butyrolactone biosynthesis enzyme [Streptomyces sp. CB09001]|uniref:ScbA/BarX family gamma-butyrolactone biosynthesis protein n=1 Tax=unclassified Streptomyces TaxID=2593676 RepID=UPI000E211D06|nr:ScbA/BarX family gamma-butyrolactone biosynthesis protein [Streptomyces sp. CB09001]AXL89644.1 gamma-butyrolactone biosynthesis enzyme [Streptomyces sp. CB09001]
MPNLAPTAPGVTAQPRKLTSTVPREYVHRAAVSEVLLTGWEHDGSAAGDRSGFVVGAQWPRCHSLFASDRGYQDPMLLVESVRQIGSLLAHAEFDVPFGYQFLMSDLSVSADPELFRADAVPTDVEMHTLCRDVVRRGRSLREMRYDVTVRRGNEVRATASAAFRCMSPDVYRRLRGERPTDCHRTPPPALDPAAVRHGSPWHVLLGEPAPATPGRWELRVDTAHPTYFDHPTDHIPGMVLLEAARQAAHAVTGLPCALLSDVRADFARYAEFDSPCWVTATVEGHGTRGELPVRVCGSQEGETVFTADLVLRPRVS